MSEDYSNTHPKVDDTTNVSGIHLCIYTANTVKYIPY